MTAEDHTTVNTGGELDLLEGQQEGLGNTQTLNMRVTDLERKLRICHDLSKHVWQDNGKRNYRLLKQIHEVSEI